MNAPRISTPTALPTTMHTLAVAGALCSSIGFVRVNLLCLAALGLLCGLGLIAGRWLHHTRLVGAAAEAWLLATLQDARRETRVAAAHYSPRRSCAINPPDNATSTTMSAYTTLAIAWL